MKEQDIRNLAVGAFCVAERAETIEIGELHTGPGIQNFASRANQIFDSLIGAIEEAHDLVHEIRMQESNDNHNGEPSPLKYEVTFTVGFMSNDLGGASWRHTVIVRRVA